MKAVLTFEVLIGGLQATDAHFAAEAVRAINVGLTLRNWCFGLFIAAFELRGADRAHYGERLVTALSDELKSRGVSNVGRRQLYQYLAFYRTYPELVRTLSAPTLALVSESVVAPEIVRTAPAQSAFPPDVLVGSLAYSHFELLLSLEDDARRRFYEAEAVRGRWSVRELRRQIGSLLFERTGLSTDKAALGTAVRETAEVLAPAQAIRDPYVFEFLGLKPREVAFVNRRSRVQVSKVAPGRISDSYAIVPRGVSRPLRAYRGQETTENELGAAGSTSVEPLR